jgi:Lon protease-like protein
MTTSLSPDAIPLFPLGVVLFPDGMLPLRIFEVRYLTMIKQCYKTGSPFGVVALTQGQDVQRPGPTPGERFHAIGTLAEIIDYQTPQPGLIEIVTRGTSRFEVTASEQTPHGLWMADIDMLPADPHVKVPSDLAYVAANLVRMLEVFESAEVSPIFEPRRFDAAGWVANRWCELLPVPAEDRQRMMEMTDPLLRLELISDLLDMTEFGR